MRVAAGMLVGEKASGELSFDPEDGFLSLETGDDGSLTIRTVGETELRRADEGSASTCETVARSHGVELRLPGNLLWIDPQAGTASGPMKVFDVALVGQPPAPTLDRETLPESGSLQEAPPGSTAAPQSTRSPAGERISLRKAFAPEPDTSPIVRPAAPSEAPDRETARAEGQPPRLAQPPQAPGANVAPSPYGPADKVEQALNEALQRDEARSRPSLQASRAALAVLIGAALVLIVLLLENPVSTPDAPTAPVATTPPLPAQPIAVTPEETLASTQVQSQERMADRADPAGSAATDDARSIASGSAAEQAGVAAETADASATGSQLPLPLTAVRAPAAPDEAAESSEVNATKPSVSADASSSTPPPADRIDLATPPPGRPPEAAPAPSAGAGETAASPAVDRQSPVGPNTLPGVESRSEETRPSGPSPASATAQARTAEDDAARDEPTTRVPDRIAQPATALTLQQALNRALADLAKGSLEEAREALDRAAALGANPMLLEDLGGEIDYRRRLRDASAGRFDSLFPSEQLVPTSEARPEMPGAEAGVAVEFTVTMEGEVRDVAVLDELPADVEQSVLGEVRRWRFEPVLFRGRPVPVRSSARVTL